MKIKRIVSVLLLVGISSVYCADVPELAITLDVDDGNIVLIMNNRDVEQLQVPLFGTNMNTFYVGVNDQYNYSFGETAGRAKLFYKFDPGIAIWRVAFESYYESYLKEQYLSDSNLFAVIWKIKDGKELDIASSPVFMLKSGDTSLNVPVGWPWKKDGVDFIIARVLDRSSLCFAFIMINNTDTSRKCHAMNSPYSTVSLRFPAGRVYMMPISEGQDDIIINSHSCFVTIIDFQNLSTLDPTFNIKDFEFGLSELIWSIKISNDESVTVRNGLIKFNGKLSDGSNGVYKAGGLLDFTTFRNNTFAPLPSVVEDVMRND
ncbi:MAG: hypothetical protein AB7F40_12205 [Victivallaceae bacterium]|nr:hypothetical protein [Victivallaceae bacterium]